MRDEGSPLKDYLQEVFVVEDADPNPTLQEEIRTRSFKYLPALLLHAPHRLNNTTLKMVADFLSAHSKMRRGRKSIFSNSEIWDMCAEYDKYLSLGSRKKCDLAKICKKYGVKEEHLKQLYSRGREKRAHMEAMYDEAQYVP